MLCPLLIVTVVLAALPLFSAGTKLNSGVDGWLNACKGVCDNPNSTCGQTVTCEGQNTLLTCGHGKALVIQSAIYGRSDRSTCSRDRALSQISNTNCGVHSSRVADICNGKRTCFIRADNNMFGEPCAGTYKYLTVTYSCQRQSVTCEAGKSMLYCANRHVLVIQSAVYGRRDTNTCSSRQKWQRLQHTNCGVQSSKVAKSCNGKTSCSVKADHRLFGDPCFGTHKYLTVTYSCQRRIVACEGQVARLTCGVGQAVTIVSAVYGRQDTRTCSARRRSSQIRNTKCSRCSTSKLAKICGGKRTCDFRVTNSLFGEPCAGTYKYLTVSYSCD